jgi:hypothetical protein
MRDARSPAELLQWFCLLGAALVWAAQLVVGFGVTVAACSPGGGGWSIDRRTWEIALTAAAAVLVLCAEVAAVAVYRDTRNLTYTSPPPPGRHHFFASAAVVGNLIFLAIVLLSGIGALALDSCRAA